MKSMLFECVYILFIL